MNRFIIEGGNRLHGELRIPGAKNAVLPILAATILNRGTSTIKNCPSLEDVRTMQEILLHWVLKFSVTVKALQYAGKIFQQMQSLNPLPVKCGAR